MLKTVILAATVVTFTVVSAEANNSRGKTPVKSATAAKLLAQRIDIDRRLAKLGLLDAVTDCYRSNRETWRDEDLLRYRTRRETLRDDDFRRDLIRGDFRRDYVRSDRPIFNDPPPLFLLPRFW